MGGQSGRVDLDHGTSPPSVCLGQLSLGGTARSRPGPKVTRRSGPLATERYDGARPWSMDQGCGSSEGKAVTWRIAHHRNHQHRHGCRPRRGYRVDVTFYQQELARCGTGQQTQRPLTASRPWPDRDGGPLYRSGPGRWPAVPVATAARHPAWIRTAASLRKSHTLAATTSLSRSPELSQGVTKRQGGEGKPPW